MRKKAAPSPKAEELMARLRAIDTVTLRASSDQDFNLVLSLALDAMLDGSLPLSEGRQITKEANRLLREAKTKRQQRT